ncbi:hypothetical protein [Desulforhopalus sp. IMCC35007]|uniref:hypothetical protein n=1 Tax=Desulforhopalus sp. IMCC35007 TaxID=2569543 RepID=UPI0010AE5A73|nr:hypothetical protein [Desulforhopalus sp. IMCC35007]TKB11265.1 hypothetical protein FCL48_04450 [Desulforhopalus sp. IMCC35007]
MPKNTQMEQSGSFKFNIISGIISKNRAVEIIDFSRLCLLVTLERVSGSVQDSNHPRFLESSSQTPAGPFNV